MLRRITMEAAGGVNLVLKGYHRQMPPGPWQRRRAPEQQAMGQKQEVNESMVLLNRRTSGLRSIGFARVWCFAPTLCFAVAILLVAATRWANASDVATPLPPIGGRLEGVVKEHGCVQYLVPLERGDYFRVVVEHRDLGLRLAVLDDNRQLKAEVFSHHLGPTVISGIAEQSGTYIIQISSLETGSSGFRYSIHLDELIQATPTRAKQQLKADAVLASANILATSWTESSLRKASIQYERAARTLRLAGRQHDALLATIRLGAIYENLGNFSLALHYYRSVIRSAARRDKRLQIDATNAAGSLLLTRAMFQSAQYFVDASLSESLSVDYPEGRAFALVELANLRYSARRMGDAQLAIDDAMSILDATPDRRVKAFALITEGYLHAIASDYSGADTLTEDALSLATSIEDRRNKEWALENLGNYYHHEGTLDRSVTAYSEALQLFLASGNRHGEAVLLDDVGHLTETLDERKALRLYNRAAEMAQSLGDTFLYGFTLGDISRLELSLHMNHDALVSCKREMGWALRVGDPFMLSSALMDVGKAYLSLGNPAIALRYLDKAGSGKLIGSYPEAQVDIGLASAEALAQLGRRGDAEAFYRNTLAMSANIGDINGEAESHYALAALEVETGRLEQARSDVESAIQLAEELRLRAGSDQLRAFWFATAHRYFTLYVDVLMQLGTNRTSEDLDSAALQASEMSRVRSLVDFLHDSGNPGDSGPSADQLRQSIARRRVLLARLEQQLEILTDRSSRGPVEQSSVTPPGDPNSEMLLSRHDDDLKSENERSFTPRMSIADMQRMLTKDDLVLEYFV
jgi:tetratricopeptide (TPR) repeat protein